jgi:Inner membrane component of T3SS, cytoplasmic domain
MSDKPRITLTEDDFRDPDPPPRAAPVLPPITAGAPVQTGGLTLKQSSSVTALNNPRVSAVLAALVGMFAAWAFTEVVHVFKLYDSVTSKTQLEAVTGFWTALISLVFVGVLVAWDRAIGGAWQEAGRRFLIAALPAAVLGFVSGFLAEVVYQHMQSSYEFDKGKAYLARAIAWALFGAGVGLTLGVVDRSLKKARNGLIGGAAGGALGGVIFEYIGEHGHSDRTSRLLGLLAIGVLAALATVIVEVALRDAWLRVVGGGMTGKEFILYHQVTRLGSSPECEIFLLKDPDIQPVHAQIEDRGGRRILTASPAAPAHVNGAAQTSHQLRSGDRIQLGHTTLLYVEKGPGFA